MFTDAYDVLFTEHLASVRRKFDALRTPLVFSAECGCWPQVQRDRGVTCRDKYPASPTPYRYLNSGSWIGTASAARRFLQLLISRAGAGSSSAQFHKLNDQELASDLYLDGAFGSDLQLDHFATIFQPMHAIDDASAVPNCDPWPSLREQKGEYTNALTNSRPSLYHFNGGGKRHHLKMESRMWWKQCAEANTQDVLQNLHTAKLRFGDKLLDFETVCPNHAEKTRAPNAERDCGAENVPNHHLIALQRR